VLGSERAQSFPLLLLLARDTPFAESAVAESFVEIVIVTMKLRTRSTCKSFDGRVICRMMEVCELRVEKRRQAW
jgi:hypothetical protein